MSPIYAPWADDQVAAIRAWQGNERFHGLTCVTHSNDLLSVHGDGLQCDKCSYWQGWVPDGLVIPPASPSTHADRKENT